MCYSDITLQYDWFIPFSLVSQMRSAFDLLQFLHWITGKLSNICVNAYFFIPVVGVDVDANFSN